MRAQVYNRVDLDRADRIRMVGGARVSEPSGMASCLSKVGGSEVVHTRARSLAHV